MGAVLKIKVAGHSPMLREFGMPHNTRLLSLFHKDSFTLLNAKLNYKQPTKNQTSHGL
jgi:hypothetical protein